MMFRRPPWQFAHPATFTAWTPLVLGASLLAWWTADRPDLITMDGSSRVSSWRDVVGGYDAVQATQAAQPIWSATGFNTRAAIAFDGTDDYLSYESMVGIPSAATPCEEWYALDQKNVPALTSSTFIGTSGGAGNGSTRVMSRAVVSGVNRARYNSSNTGTGNTITEGTIDYSGRQVSRAIDSGTFLGLEVGGVAATPVASVPAIGTTRVRFGANFATTAAAFANVSIADRLFTGILSASQATQLRAYLMRGV